MNIESEIQIQQRHINEQENKISYMEQDAAKERATLATMQANLADLLSQQARAMRDEGSTSTSVDSDVQTQQRLINEHENKISYVEQDVAKERATLATMQSKLADLMGQQASQMRKNNATESVTGGALDDLFG